MESKGLVLMAGEYDKNVLVSYFPNTTRMSGKLYAKCDKNVLVSYILNTTIIVLESDKNDKLYRHVDDKNMSCMLVT